MENYLVNAIISNAIGQYSTSFIDSCIYNSCGNFLCCSAVVLESESVFKCGLKIFFLSSQSKNTI